MIAGAHYLPLSGQSEIQGHGTGGGYIKGQTSLLSQTSLETPSYVYPGVSRVA